MSPAEITERIAAIRERLESATPGPWKHVGVFDARCYIAGCGQTNDNVPHYVNRPVDAPLHKDGARYDAELIAHAPEDLRWTLDQLEAARRDCDAAVRGLHSTIGECTMRNGEVLRPLERSRLGDTTMLSLRQCAIFGLPDYYAANADDAARSSSRGETQP